jgi:NitT/TauT family transport system ATP-binding protein
MLSVQNLQKTYATQNGSVEAIRDISFTVERGEFVCIVGPSGAGKTTLLKCLSGLLRRTSGAITLDGRDVNGPPKEMAFVFQDYTRSLMPWLTAARNIELPLKNDCPDKKLRAARVEKALEEVGLSAFADKHPWEMSGGMQQRIAIARAIAYNPEILVMDEPFASVDAQTRADLEDLTLKVARELGVTVLLVTHDIDEAVYLADKVVVLSSRPTTVLETVPVTMPRIRDQLNTKSLPEFAELRARVLKLIRRVDASPTAVSESASLVSANHDV